MDCDNYCDNDYNYINYICLDDDICPDKYSKKIKEKNICISNCNLDNIYKYEFNNTCYKQNELYSIDLEPENDDNI